MATELEKRDKKEVKHTGVEQIYETGNAYAPDVDIYASDDEVLFAVDVPGVEKGDVHIEVDENNNLIIRAKSSTSEPAESVVRQFVTGNYYRSFQISNEYDKDRIEAKLDNGLLEIHIPKKEEAKPRRIEISA